jgi:three-Cys-motif partner protein
LHFNQLEENSVIWCLGLPEGRCYYRAVPEDVIWPLLPHTAAKHSILRRYLDAWFPILASWAKRVVFIDGFAGPGEYERGELGSPMIAVRAATEHKRDLSSAELVYLFIEADPERFAHLERLLRRTTLPKYVKWRAVRGEFAKVMETVLETIEGDGSTLAPALIMVDPFGFSGMPMSTLRRLARHPRTEFLVSFMYEPIVRWLDQPPQGQNFDDLFGSADWRNARNLSEPDERKQFLLGLYLRELKAAGMNLTRAFEMIDRGNRTEYYLIFATHSLDGLRAMKAAMWKVDPSGGIQFSDATVSSQLKLFTLAPDYDRLKRQIVARFGGRQLNVETLEEFVLIDTEFRETHYKKQVLASMERSGELEVVESSRQRRYAYPPGTIIRFR